MPEDLKNPEGMFPFHYDPRYEEAPNPFEPGAPDTDGYLQSIAFDVSGKKLGPKALESLKEILEAKGLFHRNMGDESFRDEVRKQIQRLVLARKVAERCLFQSTHR